MCAGLGVRLEMRPCQTGVGNTRAKIDLCMCNRTGVESLVQGREGVTPSRGADPGE